MKRNARWPGLLVLGSGLAGLGAWAASSQPAQPPLPTPFPEARYQRMSARSPFAIASAAAATPAATPGFAAQLYVDGVARVGRTDFVAIKSRDPDNKSVIFLEVGKSTDDGLKVERVQWSDEMTRSTVDVSKGGEKATLAFDEQQIAKVPPTVMAGPSNDQDGNALDPTAPRAMSQEQLDAYRARWRAMHPRRGQ